MGRLTGVEKLLRIQSLTMLTPNASMKQQSGEAFP